MSPRCDAGSFSDDTWTYDFNTNTWANMEPAAGPLARRLPAMAYDSDSDRVILFGGYGWGGNYDDTWAYDFNTNTWTSMNPTAKPTSTLQAMAYDSQSDRAILFGGASYVDPQNTTWAYDFNTNNWTNMQPVSQPLASYGHAMAYDSASDRVIVFGGVDRNGSALNETWAYDFNTNNWTNLNPVSKLPTRLYHAMAYDSQSDRVILVGGYTQSGQPDYDIWAYDFNANTWTSMDPLDKPRARVYHSMAYDFQSDRVILFGGSDFIQGAVLNDTWAYDLESNTWTYMATRPPGRFEHAMAYDSASDRVILFGGEGSPFLDEETSRELDSRLRSSRLARPDPVERDRYLFYTACTRATRRLPRRRCRRLLLPKKVRRVRTKSRRPLRGSAGGSASLRS